MLDLVNGERPQFVASQAGQTSEAAIAQEGQHLVLPDELNDGPGVNAGIHFWFAYRLNHSALWSRVTDGYAPPLGYRLAD